MRVLARRLSGYAHEVEIEDGAHRLVVDEPTAVPGGTDSGPSPTRLLAAALASCIAITMEMYANRKGWEIGTVEVEVEVAYEGFAPSAFAAVVRLPPGLTEEQRARLLAVARKCPVSKVIANETPVTDRIEDQVDA